MNTSMTQHWNRRSIAMTGLVLSLGVLLVCHYLRTSASTASDSTLRDSSTTQASLQPSSNIPDMIPADFQPEARHSPTEIELLPIEQIKVGMRVPALNPEVTDEERATFKDPDPATWQLMELEHEKPDGGVLLISMLRPIEWIHQQGIHSGGSFQIDMPELGAKGLAKILALKPCPKIQAGPGHVVLSTFAHPATHEILDVTIGQGEDAETIGVTETHPFWSVQDQAFVPVGHLVAGSQVLTADEQTKTITNILPRPGPPQQVYNLEVNGEHVYYVGQQQLLVHNEGCLIPVRFDSSPDGVRLFEEASSYRKQLTANGADYAGRNIAIVDVIIDGNRKTVRFLNTPKNKQLGQIGIHSEERLIIWYELMRSQNKQVEVLRVFSDRIPCGIDRANCLGKLEDAFGSSIEVYYNILTGSL